MDIVISVSGKRVIVDGLGGHYVRSHRRGHTQWRRDWRRNWSLGASFILMDSPGSLDNVFHIFLAMLKFIQSSMDLICVYLIEQDPSSIIYIHLGSLIITMIILLLGGQHIQMFFANISTALALLVLRLITS